MSTVNVNFHIVLFRPSVIHWFSWLNIIKLKAYNAFVFAVTYHSYNFSQEKPRKRRILIYLRRYWLFVKKRFWDTYKVYFGMLNQKTNVGKLKNGVFTI